MIFIIVDVQDVMSFLDVPLVPVIPEKFLCGNIPEGCQEWCAAYRHLPYFFFIFPDFHRSDEPIFLQIKAVLSAFILPYFSAIAVCTAYVFVKIFKGFKRGSILTIVSGILAMIGVIALSVAGPLFFLVGILCIHIWGRRVRGIILCALGLVLMILSNHLTIRIMEKQKDELNIQRGYPVWR